MKEESKKIEEFNTKLRALVGEVFDTPSTAYELAEYKVLVEQFIKDTKA